MNNEERIWKNFNQFLLSNDTSRLRKLLIRYELFKMSMNVPGDIVECGVFKGVGMMYWRKLIEIFAPGSNRSIIGFDTYEGYSNTCCDFEQKEKEKFMAEANYKNTNVVELKEFFISNNLGERIDFIVGDIIETSSQYVKNNPGFRIALLHLDFDTYEGTKAALDAFFPVVSRGGVIVLDEYAIRGWGESDAVDVFFADYPNIEIKAVLNSKTPTAYIVKP